MFHQQMHGPVVFPANVADSVLSFILMNSLLVTFQRTFVHESLITNIASEGAVALELFLLRHQSLPRTILLAALVALVHFRHR